MPNIFKGTADKIENTDNKITSLNAECTDEQYPSAKAVVDAISKSNREAALSDSIVWNPHFIQSMATKHKIYHPLDINHDGIIDGIDFELLGTFISGWTLDESYPWVGSNYYNCSVLWGDINGDGTINNKDIGILERYVNGWKDIDISPTLMGEYMAQIIGVLVRDIEISPEPPTTAAEGTIWFKPIDEE